MSDKPKPRTVKAADVRRGEILDVAQRLFFENGFDTTSVAAIIDAVGLSKGAFYHHFKSKDDLLEALAMRMTDEALAQTQPIVDDPARTPLDKLNAVFGASRRLKVEQAPVIRAMIPVIFSPANLRLRERLESTAIGRSVPIVARLIRDGVAVGQIDAIDPEGAAELILRVGTIVNDTVAKVLGEHHASLEARRVAADAFDRRLRLYEQAVNRILAVPDGTIRIHEPGFAKALLDAP